jgi:hypothetical protein
MKWCQAMKSEIQSLHDWSILSINFSEYPCKFIVNCRSDFDEKCEISFAECRLLKVNNVIGQNIISRVIVYDQSNYVHDEVENLIDRASRDEEGALLIDKEALVSLAGKIREGQLSLAYFEPSWGCELFVAASSIKVDRLVNAPELR